MKKEEFSLEFFGKELKAQFNDLADQANGSCMLSCGETVVLATAVISNDGDNNPGYFNLQVEYSEKFYAVGKLLGSRFMKREGRPTTKGTLSARIIDRTIRPLFDQRIQNSVQIIVSVLAVGEVDPTFLAVNAVSLALGTSDIPWSGPVGAVRVIGDNQMSDVKSISGPNDGSEKNMPPVDLFVCGLNNSINMIEGATFETKEDVIDKYLDIVNEGIEKIEAWQKNIIAKIGKKKLVFEFDEVPENAKAVFADRIFPTLQNELFGEDSKERIQRFHIMWKEIVSELYPEATDEQKKIRNLCHEYFHSKVDEILHDKALSNDMRADLRKMNEVRSIFAQAGGVSTRLHGSGIFYRGGTHIFSALTIGGPEDRLLEDGMEVEGERRFYHHYNFPPFSAGETGRVGGFNRRAVGHGMLAEKALIPVLPSYDEFPYTMRLVSESTASNGSTSQASICGSSLALMDGGVPIKRMVAGIAMGAMIDKSDKTKYKILTDIQGPEDHHGDMDFKVAGTTEGVTAIQLDIKLDGIPVSILKEALRDAKQARENILEVMVKEIPEPRADLSPYAPRIVKLRIPEEKIGKVIGSGGKNIQELQERTKTIITIEDDGSVFITGPKDGINIAQENIEAVTKTWQPGDQGNGEIIKIIDGVGVIIKISPYEDGMVHISEIANFRVEKIENHLKLGQSVPFTILKVDNDKGRISLSIRTDNPTFVKKPQ